MLTVYADCENDKIHLASHSSLVNVSEVVCTNCALAEEATESKGDHFTKLK